MNKNGYFQALGENKMKGWGWKADLPKSAWLSNCFGDLELCKSFTKLKQREKSKGTTYKMQYDQAV